MADRLQKVLAHQGIASRRRAEELIVAGRVRVNGQVAHLGQKVDPQQDFIELDGVSLQTHPKPEHLYILLHKPLGVVSTCADPQGRPTVLDHLPSTLHQGQGLHPVGRLDFNSTGALLLSNDGDFTFRLTHPRHPIAKTYRVWVQGHPSPDSLQRWRSGLPLDGKLTLPATVKRVQQKPDRTCLQIQLWEGRNRQIRRVAEQLGHPVLRLHRTAIGPLSLDPLPPGQWRHLTLQEIQNLTQVP
ncbi:MAG: pseudouridine synthase [Prochlorothrix sp.]